MRTTTQKILLSFFCFSLSACGIVQSNSIENMSKNERLELLRSKKTGELCNALLHPIIKEKTKSDIEEILIQRNISVCYVDEKEIPISKHPSNSSGGAKEKNEPTEMLPGTTIVDTGGTLKPVSAEEWKLILGPSYSNSYPSSYLANKAASILDEATRLLSNGRTKDAAEQQLRGVALSIYYGESSQDPKLLDAINKNKKHYLKVGVTPEILSASIANLKSVFPQSTAPSNMEQPLKKEAGRENESTEKPKPSTKPQPVRKATPSEVKTFKSAVKQRLKDPTSPIFGEMLVIGAEKACVAVNAKNSFGAYVGASAYYLVKMNGAWKAVYDTKFNVKMCANVIAQPKS